jgi:PAS domain S-box-containing protein
MYNDKGVVTSVVGVSTDISELHITERKYRHIVETAREGIWQIDIDACTVFVNERLAEMFGYTVEEMIGRPIFDFFDESGIDLAQHYIQQHQDGQFSHFDFEFRRKDGAPLWVMIAANPLTDVDGNYTGSLGMITDITARKQAEQELHDAKQDLERRVEERTAEIRTMVERLEQANLEQKRFVADASHDLRTPLTVISAEADLLLDRPDLDPEIRRSLEVVRRQAARLDDLATDLLALSRFDSHAGMVPISDVRIDELVLESASQLSTLAREKGISWNLECEDPIEIECDPAWIRRALTNVMENALKYSATRVPVHIRLSESDGMVLIEIADSGIGISENDLPNIFNRFYRGDSARSTPGTGLGLSIVKSAIEAHSGRIEIVSTPGNGTTVAIWLQRQMKT